MKNRKLLKKVKVAKKPEGFFLEVLNWNNGYDKIGLFSRKEDAISRAEKYFENYFARVFSVEDMNSVWENYTEDEMRSHHMADNF